MELHPNATFAMEIQVGGRSDEKIVKWERLQAVDKWIWTFFYSSLTAVKCGKRSLKESLAHCESCPDLYWRDGKHCRICHSTFEVGFDLVERYAIHVATCKEPDDLYDVLNHKVLPSQLHALKAAIHAIEACMPVAAFAGLWMKSSWNLWVKRLRRTSSLPELMQAFLKSTCRRGTTKKYVGVLGMNSICKSLCQEDGVMAEFGVTIGKMDWLQDRSSWALASLDGKDLNFDYVVATDKNVASQNVSGLTGKPPPLGVLLSQPYLLAVMTIVCGIRVLNWLFVEISAQAQVWKGLFLVVSSACSESSRSKQSQLNPSPWPGKTFAAYAWSRAPNYS